MRYPPSLERDLGSFFDSLFALDTYRKEASRLFDAAVSRHCVNLLTENHTYTSMTDSTISSDPWMKSNPKQALTLLELLIRALAAQKDTMVRGKKIDVRRMLSERVKLANKNPRIFARRII
jgi:hypothetical protein